MIDLLAVSAWTKPKPARARFERIGYEVKISRADYRRELLRPGKRALAVGLCHEFYFATPLGLLSDEEKAYVEPEWSNEDWRAMPCPGFLGHRCYSGWRRKTHYVEIPRPSTGFPFHELIVCPTCGGKGRLGKSRVEREAPNLWIPNDVGLIEIGGRGTANVVRRAPLREPRSLSDAELARLIRWVSVRPDPRHERFHGQLEVKLK